MNEQWNNVTHIILVDSIMLIIIMYISQKYDENFLKVCELLMELSHSETWINISYFFLSYERYTLIVSKVLCTKF